MFWQAENDLGLSVIHSRKVELSSYKCDNIKFDQCLSVYDPPVTFCDIAARRFNYNPTEVVAFMINNICSLWHNGSIKHCLEKTWFWLLAWLLQRKCIVQLHSSNRPRTSFLAFFFVDETSFLACSSNLHLFFLNYFCPFQSISNFFFGI